MAGSLSKLEELLGLIPELLCHNCKSVPGPNKKQKNRYSCINAAHTLCEDHKTECPCGSKVVKSPSRVIAKLLQNLPWMCQNYKTGCRESKTDVEELEHHQGKCIYRQIFCPNVVCNNKVIFKDVIDHLKTFHKLKIIEHKMIPGKVNIYHVRLDNSNNFSSGSAWVPCKITTSCGAVFFTVGKAIANTVYFWTIFLGSSDEARRYSCKYSVVSKIGEKFNFEGPVHTLDKDRYSCTDAAHTLCEEHKAKCPCGSFVGKIPSPFIAKFLQDKPWMCQNYKNGCLESKMDLVDLEHHRVKCIYRQVFCPRVYCKEKKVLFKNVFDHLKTCLKKPIFEEKIYN